MVIAVIGALVGIIAAVLAVVGLIAAFRPSTMRVEVSSSNVSIRLSWPERIAAFSEVPDIPLGGIATVSVLAREQVPGPGLKITGAGLSGQFSIGRFQGGGRGARDFWNVRRGSPLLVISLKPNGKYRQVVLELADPEAVRDEITAALIGHRPSS